jgi:hypothetical protein
VDEGDNAAGPKGDNAAGPKGRPRAGRPERVIDPADGPPSGFAHALRQVRAAAGYPSYRVLAKKALFAPSVLSSAASGMSLPTLEVTLAYARACGADTAEWRLRWEAVAAELGGYTPGALTAYSGDVPVQRLAKGAAEQQRAVADDGPEHPGGHPFRGVRRLRLDA